MAVYEYMQSKTRYVSIQLGIGGFQPFEASVVDELGYGDCKALSNYTLALLEAVGIKGNYVLIYGGSEPPPFMENFPSSQFNHAIACVPLKNDTIWLECTSQTNPFGYLGSFTGNRKALMITDNGAKVVNTARYGENENGLSRTAEVTVDVNGNAAAKVRTIHRGIEYDHMYRSSALGSNFDEQKKWVQENTDIPAFDIRSFNIKNNKVRHPSANVTLDLALNKFATVSGKRLFLNPNLMNRSSFIPPKLTERKQPVVLRNAYTHVDTINYNVPEHLYPEFLPEPVVIKSRFGQYESKFSMDQGKVVYIRKFIRRKGEFPPESYQEFIDFYKAVNKADQVKIVFMTKT
jgi:hypothetical protein